MTHSQKVASYKAYLQTGDPQFIPYVYEKTAHVDEVQAWKARWSKTAGCGLDHSKKKKKKKKGAYYKEARAGHPANVALARALSPGILPGLNPGGSKVHASHNGDFNHDIAAFMEEGVDPGTRAYLRGEKTAVKAGPPRSGKPPAPSNPKQPNRRPPTPAPPYPVPPQPNSKYKNKGPATRAYPGNTGKKAGRPDLPPGHPDLPNVPDPGWKDRWGKAKQIVASEQPLSLSDILRRAVAQREIAKEGQQFKQAAAAPGAKAVAAPAQSERAKYYNSPTTEEDLYRRYGRVPESSREKVRSRSNYWAQQPQEDYRLGVTDRITAENRAATTKNLKLPKTPLSARLRQLAEGAFNVARYAGNPFQVASGVVPDVGTYGPPGKRNIGLKFPSPPSEYDAGIPRGGNLSIPALPGRSTEEIAKEGRQFKQAAVDGPWGEALGGAAFAGPALKAGFRLPETLRDRAEQAEFAASPATEDDLYRRYGRLPKYGPLGQDSRPTKAVDREPSEYAPQRGAQRLGGGLGFAARKIREALNKGMNSSWFGRKDPNEQLPQFSGYRPRGRGMGQQQAAGPLGSAVNPWDAPSSQFGRKDPNEQLPQFLGYRPHSPKAN